MNCTDTPDTENKSWELCSVLMYFLPGLQYTEYMLSDTQDHRQLPDQKQMDYVNHNSNATNQWRDQIEFTLELSELIGQ